MFTHTIHSLGNSQLFPWRPWFLNMCKSWSSWVELGSTTAVAILGSLAYSAMAVTTPTYLTDLELVSCPDRSTRPIWNETLHATNNTWILLGLQQLRGYVSSFHFISISMICPYLLDRGSESSSFFINADQSVTNWGRLVVFSKWVFVKYPTKITAEKLPLTITAN